MENEDYVKLYNNIRWILEDYIGHSELNKNAIEQLILLFEEFKNEKSKAN
jgi:hypothetical protein